MYSVAFIFEIKEYDEQFHQLDDAIADVAKSLDGFLGKEGWKAENGRINSTYYWDSLETLKQFAKHPTHIEAKRLYARWYTGYHIVISEVIRSYGDGGFEHITGQQRK